MIENNNVAIDRDLLIGMVRILRRMAEDATGMLAQLGIRVDEQQEVVVAPRSAPAPFAPAAARVGKTARDILYARHDAAPKQQTDNGGWKHTPQTIAAISAGVKAAKAKRDARNAMNGSEEPVQEQQLAARDAPTRRPISAEARARMSAAQRARRAMEKEERGNAE